MIARVSWFRMMNRLRHLRQLREVRRLTLRRSHSQAELDALTEGEVREIDQIIADLTALDEAGLLDAATELFTCAARAAEREERHA